MLTASAIASAAKQSELRAVSVIANPFLICHCERSEAIYAVGGHCHCESFFNLSLRASFAKQSKMIAHHKIQPVD